MDKDQKEALQVTKELVGKFIETRTVTPANFAEIFPMVHEVVRRSLSEESHMDSARPTDALKEHTLGRKEP